MRLVDKKLFESTPDLSDRWWGGRSGWLGLDNGIFRDQTGRLLWFDNRVEGVPGWLLGLNNRAWGNQR